MKIEDIGVLSEVFCRVLEQTAFMFAVPTDINELNQVPGTQSYLQSCITFSGQCTGLISFTIPEELSIEIAANIIGANLEIEGQLAIEQKNDAISEMINILCGQFLTMVEGDKPVFDLSVPVASQLSPSDWIALKALDGTAGLMIDDYPVLLHMAL